VLGHLGFSSGREFHTCQFRVRLARNKRPSRRATSQAQHFRSCPLLPCACSGPRSRSGRYGCASGGGGRRQSICRRATSAHEPIITMQSHAYTVHPANSAEVISICFPSNGSLPQLSQLRSCPGFTQNPIARETPLFYASGSFSAPR